MSMAESTTEQPGPRAQNQKTTNSLPPLPHVVWRRIAYFLSDTLSTLLDISSLSPDLRDICRPHISSFFHIIATPVSPLSSTYYYHDLVWLVLEGRLDASSILEFHYLDHWKVKDPLPSSAPAILGTFSKSATSRRKDEFDRLLHGAVHSSAFIPSDLESEVCDRFYRGDEDAALAILLPLFTHLKIIEPPVRFEMCAAVFQSVAQEYRRRGTSAEDARQHATAAALRDRNSISPQKRQANDSSTVLPFSELLTLHLGAHQHGYNFPLSEILPFMGIPSLSRIILCGLRDQIFPGWPASEVNPTCPEIYFSQSSVSREAVLAFAQELSAPCEIRQWYERPRPDVSDSDPNDPDWDRVLVTTDSAGDKHIEVSLEYEGGNPGYDYAWVSWLCWGKMQDWRRIDEEFALQEDDSEEPYLQGLFA